MRFTEYAGNACKVDPAVKLSYVGSDAIVHCAIVHVVDWTHCGMAMPCAKHALLFLLMAEYPAICKELPKSGDDFQQRWKC